MQAASGSRNNARSKSIIARCGAGRIALLALIAALAIGFVQADGLHYLSIDYLKAQQAAFAHERDLHPVATSLVFCAVYVIVTALSIPGATVLTLAAGALFGAVWGTGLVSFASTLGAALAFGMSRYLLRVFVHARFPDRVRAINTGIEREGWMYLLSLRLIPVIPSWLINLLMGVTSIRLSTFWWASQMGTLPATALYVGVGTRLASVTSLGDAVSPAVLAALLALAVLPYAARRVLGLLRRRRG
ncbi:TVP38/TMEM64 family protein [Bordetella sp. FB-8]|uniref:TVP38/TMEM64 family protein n=1 Tax=Bordetella sp. FB-8 TaxID=1159870 RepID=UPI00036B2C7B|nr:TVP38/TMEM64 family protein [Bordetella sp. FB-8]